jgi:hypothetical protein
MSDGPVSSPEANLASQGEILQNKEGISLYKSEKFNVFVPKKPNIPLNEGLHIQVSDGHDRDDSPRDVLARYLMMEGAVKMLGECSLTPDVFPNTRLEKGQIVAGYGRVFGEDSSMGKPVDTLNRNVP